MSVAILIAVLISSLLLTDLLALQPLHWLQWFASFNWLTAVGLLLAIFWQIGE